MEELIKAYAPASIGNVIVGFDVLGLAVNEPGDEVSVKFNDNQKTQIVKIEGDNGKLPKEVDKNTAGIAVNAFLRKLDSRQGVDIHLKKNLPLGSGLGSSAASAVAAVVAANKLFNEPFTKTELLPFLMEAEAMASGSAHADNIAPCLLGGLVMTLSNSPVQVKQLPFLKDVWIVLTKPNVEILTKQARMLLKETVPLNNVVSQFSNLSGFIAAIYENDVDLMRRTMQDYIAEPVRAQLIPGYIQIKDIAQQNNAIGCGISGSGPTMFALVETKKQADSLSEQFQQAFQEINIGCLNYVTQVSEAGAQVL